MLHCFGKNASESSSSCTCGSDSKYDLAYQVTVETVERIVLRIVYIGDYFAASSAADTPLRPIATTGVFLLVTMNQKIAYENDP